MYTCKECNKQFEKYNSFSVHCNRKHNISYSDLRTEYFPKIEKEFKCIRCDSSFDNYQGLRKHVARLHKINSENFYIEYKLNGIKPICKCGCGKETNWNKYDEGFREYIKGHQSRVINNWGHNETAKLKSTETRRNQYKNGERKVWNDGLTKETSDVLQHLSEITKKENNPERARKISNALTGKKKSPEHVEKIKEHTKKYWSKQENRDKQRNKRLNYMNKYLKINETKLEKNFKLLLDSLNIKYTFQAKLGDFNYDFLLNKNIIVEVDGDFWHCNPNIYDSPIYDCQKHTISHDKIKTRWAEDNGYTLLRFWETDINSNITSVIKVLLNKLEEK